jgi:hypothetical protein
VTIGEQAVSGSEHRLEMNFFNGTHLLKVSLYV